MVYLDSSAIVKRYVLEDGTDLVQEAYTISPKKKELTQPTSAN
jgi:predicted nucleic acid-binding protein